MKVTVNNVIEFHLKYSETKVLEAYTHWGGEEESNNFI